MGWKDFFTLKTTSELFREAEDKHYRKSEIENPTGLDSEIAVLQKRLDALKSKSSDFLIDIQKHFGDNVKFVGTGYVSDSNSSNLDNPERRKFAMKWQRSYGIQVMSGLDYETDRLTDISKKWYQDTGFEVVMSFSYVATPNNGIRVDYIFELKDGGSRETTNEKYDPDNSDSSNKEVREVHDVIKSTRRFATHGDFLAEGVIPAWFIEKLEKYAIVAGSGDSNPRRRD